MILKVKLSDGREVEASLYPVSETPSDGVEVFWDNGTGLNSKRVVDQAEAEDTIKKACEWIDPIQSSL